MKKNKILIVDDNKLNRQSLADIFRKDYQIAEAEDGKKALEYQKSKRFWKKKNLNPPYTLWLTHWSI